MSKLDRYIIRQIITTLLFSIIALCVIFIVVNLMETMDKFIDAGVELKIIIKYYAVYLPEILKILTPVSILISCLLTIGKLSNNNELTAMKSGGMSLYRIIFPIAILGIVLSGMQYYFNGWVVPIANEEKEHISQVYLKKFSSDTYISNLAFRASPTRNVLIRYYDASNKTAQRVVVEDYIYVSEEERDKSIKEVNKVENGGIIPRLISRIEARQMIWNEALNSWQLESGIVKKIYKDKEIEVEKFTSLPIDINILPRQLSRMNKKAEQLTFDEIKSYIGVLKAGGKNIRKLEIDYRSEQALPLANFIVILFAVSFASVKKRGGLAVQIAAAMVIAFSYLMCFQLAKPIGLAVDVSAILVGWSANILFFIVGIITLFKTRT